MINTHINRTLISFALGGCQCGSLASINDLAYRTCDVTQHGKDFRLPIHHTRMCFDHYAGCYEGKTFAIPG